MNELWNLLMAGAGAAVVSAAFQSVYQKRWGNVAKLREVYANWGGAMLSLIISQQAATDVAEGEDAPPSLLLALPENQNLVDAVDRDRRVVFRYQYEIHLLEDDERYLRWVDNLTQRNTHWDHDAAADPELDSPGVALELELGGLADDLRRRWKDWWALLEQRGQREST